MDEVGSLTMPLSARDFQPGRMRPPCCAQESVRGESGLGRVQEWCSGMGGTQKQKTPHP